MMAVGNLPGSCAQSRVTPLFGSRNASHICLSHCRWLSAERAARHSVISRINGYQSRMVELTADILCAIRLRTLHKLVHALEERVFLLFFFSAVTGWRPLRHSWDALNQTVQEVVSRSMMCHGVRTSRS
ncbi:hypothetical protein K503DRAFT_388446 [Rhizopogon vinicolor AM-OR11-026]|uniref:Uncharacterized protein n=1 Tax=Rhizopogon vinicolor AM-OR11-026 TaxID=1314800 RepID=A0A1B7NBQ4_9AGAM|nr:hypothetical protein K503DRAFT_388446 [Rhizopogon vinicolor AM-OR11-026]